MMATEIEVFTQAVAKLKDFEQPNSEELATTAISIFARGAFDCAQTW